MLYRLLPSLVDGFFESAERFPSRFALVVGSECLSYLDLSFRACAIASSILRYEETRFPLAALLACRSVTAYAGLLGILAAGKGYVPLNPKFPAERTRRMLRLSGCTVLVVGREALPQLPSLLRDSPPLTAILPDVSDASDLARAFPQHRFISSAEICRDNFCDRPPVSPAAVAYLLFTSGSTGDPKGVPVSQSNVTSYVRYICNRYEVTERDRFSQEFDLTFDLSVHDMFVCWERGACLHCVPEKAAMAPAKFIRDHRLTMWFSVPSVVGILGKMRLLSPGCFPSLRYSFFCGESLSAAYAQLWQEAAPNSILENLYGPTETTIAISHYRWDKSNSPNETLNGVVPIGWIFEGQRCCIIDEKDKLVATGESGELCLSGSQVTSGYWNDPGKSQKQFVRLPASTAETVWYRTGDLVKQDGRGCLYYQGRIDQQVKIRGYRVELQEVEAALREACGTEQVVSVAWPLQNGTAEGLVAFVSGVESMDEHRILARCSEVLPDYMIPKKIYVRDELPLNANGKIDRRSLASLLASDRK